jgi:hypothetical protein
MMPTSGTGAAELSVSQHSQTILVAWLGAEVDAAVEKHQGAHDCGFIVCILDDGLTWFLVVCA